MVKFFGFLMTAIIAGGTLPNFSEQQSENVGNPEISDGLHRLKEEYEKSMKQGSK